MVLGYVKTMEFVISFMNVEPRYLEKTLELIDQKKFLYLKCILLACCGSFFLLFYFLEKIYVILSVYIKDLFVSTTSIIKEELTSNTKYVFIIPFLSAIYFAYEIPVNLDEAGTYIDFVSRGLPVSMSWYYTTNNHILNSVLAGFTKYIPFLPALIKLRMGAIFFNLLAIIFGTHFLKKYYNESFAFAVMAITSMLWMNVYYSFLARGYSIVLFCLIVSIHFAFNIFRDNKTRNWVWLSFISIVGFYAMPSYLYPFAIINLIILIENYKSINAIKKQTIAIITTVVVTFILYIPVFIVNGGISAVTKNKFIAAQITSRSEVLLKLPLFFYDTIKIIFGINPNIVLSIFLFSVLFLIKGKDMFKIKLTGIFIVTPFLLLIAHSLIAFSRTFNYYGFVLVFLIMLPFEKHFQRINTKILLLFLIPIQIILLLNFNSTYRNSPFADDVPMISHDIITKIIGNKNYVINMNCFEGPLIFELKSNNFNKYKVISTLNKNICVDTVKNADYVIIDLKNDKTKTKTPIYSNRYYNVYANSLTK